jgi:hypothetical protein
MWCHARLQVQLVRLQIRVPEYGWTTQKVFHLLNCLVSGLRCAVLFFRPALENLHPTITKLMLLDLPGTCAGEQAPRCTASSFRAAVLACS